MSSILTNTSSMVALQTLRSISNDLAKTQDMISTGKRISTAKDSAAIWSISKVMESDVKGFEAITDSLNLGMSTTAVARNAAESVNEMLQEVKTRIIAAQEENVDRNKLQSELVSLRGQIASIVNSAQFNGLSMLSNREQEAGTGSVDVLASLNRTPAGDLTSETINVSKQDLGTEASVVNGAAADFTAAAAGNAVLLNATQTATIDIGANAAGFEAGTAYVVSVVGTDADASSFGTAFNNAAAVGMTEAEAEAATQQIKYVTRDGDTAADVARALADRFAVFAVSNNLSEDALTITANGGELSIASTLTDGTDTIAVGVNTMAAGGNTVGGGLEVLSTLDISTSEGAGAALVAIESLIQTSIDAAAEFGTAEKRVEIQSEFTSRLIDSLRAGIGALVDTDMEAASAQLQALQVQQQLGVQALSIANQAPQTILSLFQ